MSTVTRQDKTAPRAGNATGSARWLHSLGSALWHVRSRPYGLAAITWLYMFWALVPVIIAMKFSFNAGRSISAWQGFDLTRWYWGDPVLSVWQNSGLQSALFQSLTLAGLAILVATPLGVLLALGLARWRGRGQRPANFLMLFPLVTPEIVLAVALYMVFMHIFVFINPSTLAQMLGQVTFALAYVVIVVRGRLASIGMQYEEAAADLGATRLEMFTKVLVPLMMPAIVASAMIVFAISIDNFVITQWMSCGSGCDTIPVRVYSAARSSPLPSINALATIMVLMSVTAVGLAFGAYRYLTRHERARTPVNDD